MLSDAAHKDPAMSGQLQYDRVDGDFYPTPPEYLDCLAHFVDLSGLGVWEPACGEGHLSKRLSMLAHAVLSSDLFDRGFGTGGIDFLKSTKLPQILPMNGGRPAIITNPPYGDEAEQFVRHALELTKDTGGLVAMFLRNEWDCSGRDRADLFEGHPAYAMKIVVTKRPRWFEKKKGDKSPRHNFSWFVWDWSKAPGDPAIRYIHPNNARPITAATKH